MSDPILVTGAAGFVGSRLVEALAGQPVISVDHPEYFQTRTEHSGISYGKVIDRAHLFEWLPGQKLSAVFHLGACTDTTEMDRDYLNRVNLEYSQKLWSHCSENKIPFFYASSAATYGDGSLGYDDDEASMKDLHPLNPYGESKLQFDLWALGREKEGFHPPAWAGFKFFNVYGFGERHKVKMSSVIVQAFDQIQKTGEMKLFQSHREGVADGHQSRDFILVEDVVDVLLFAMNTPLKRGIYNLGSGKARTFMDLVQATFKALGKQEVIHFIPTPEAIRDRYQYFTQANMKKLREAGYTKEFTVLEDGVSRYVAQLLNSQQGQ